MEPKQLDFEDLPNHLHEIIFNYISLPEIVRLSQVSPIFQTIGNNVIRKKFVELHSGIYKELKSLKEELDVMPKTQDFINDRIIRMRSYYFLEVLISEINLIRAVWRKTLYRKGGNTVPIGKLLHEFYSAFYLAKAKVLPPWHINDITEVGVIKSARSFFEYKLNDLQIDQLFGCQILDVLDSMIRRQYNINVKYHPEINQCTIDSVYKLRHPKYLTRPPSHEDRKTILSYFINLVRINNRATLREEQYHRETEATRFTLRNLLDIQDELELNESSSWLAKNVREYEPIFINPRREERKVNNGVYEFEETYRSTEFNHSTNIEKKLICNIQVRCPLNEAPLAIMDCWSRLKSCLLTQLYIKPHFIFLDDSLERKSGASHGSDIIDVLGEYTLQLTVEACVTTNTNDFEICRLVISEPS